VPHSSTKFFSSHENLERKIFVYAHSEREARRVSSVEDVTAARAVHRERGKNIKAQLRIEQALAKSRGTASGRVGRTSPHEHPHGVWVEVASAR
jgi:hypothetical protein